MYVRMSTEHQKYSIENQSDAIRSYAERHNMEIVRTYSDSGKSGLKISGRAGLSQLIDDVQTNQIQFNAIIVYDISRWGRFQDADEGAYYEYICRNSGVSVHYCAEQFENDGSPNATIIKSVKRAMAGEYSRELSNKVFVGQCRLIELGFRQGGPAGYGLKRMLVDAAGTHKGILERGQHKSLQTDRVILVPGPPEEVSVVNRIYRHFVEEGKSEAEIANSLNAEGLRTDLRRPWSRGTIRQILTNEKYIGNNVFNRTSFKLKKNRTKNVPELWVRREGAFEPIVTDRLFHMAEGIIQERTRRFTDEEMLAKLKQLYTKYGYLSGVVIDESGAAPFSGAYARRFGNLMRAYELVGFTPDRDYRYIEINRRLRRYHATVVDSVVSEIMELGATAIWDHVTEGLVINGEFRISIVIARCQATPAGSSRWRIRLEAGLRPDITVAVRMDETNEGPLDYYLLPRIVFAERQLKLAHENGVGLDTYRYDDLGYLFYMAERCPLQEVA
ncbi:MAG: recombinase family protein [Alphaproteobacteria bacterium]|nr:recombinase family protein [Alphaproteobacteria bacterium]